jgi:hypothetical protein
MYSELFLIILIFITYYNFIVDLIKYLYFEVKYICILTKCYSLIILCYIGRFFIIILRIFLRIFIEFLLVYPLIPTAIPQY